LEADTHLSGVNVGGSPAMPPQPKGIPEESLNGNSAQQPSVSTPTRPTRPITPAQPGYGAQPVQPNQPAYRAQPIQPNQPYGVQPLNQAAEPMQSQPEPLEQKPPSKGFEDSYYDTSDNEALDKEEDDKPKKKKKRFGIF